MSLREGRHQLLARSPTASRVDATLRRAYRSPVAGRGRLLYARARSDAHWMTHREKREQMTARFTLATLRSGLPESPSTIARHCLETRALSDTLLQHPEMWKTIGAPSQEIEAVLALGRGIVLTSIHSPTMWVATAAASAVLGHDIVWAVSETILGEDGDAQALPRGAMRDGVGGSTLIRASDAYIVMRKRLQERGTVGVLFDVPGRVEVQLLGKSTFVHPWFAKLARRHDSVIVPCMACWERNRLSIRFGPTVIPEPDEALQALCQRTASSIETLWKRFPDHWSPYTGKLWPNDVGPYKWAFDDDWD